MWRSCAVLAALLLCSICQQQAPAAAQDVISIGGFVTVSKQLSAALTARQQQNPDLQAVRIQLLSSTSIKVAEGDCSPNGYYFVPVEAAGSYTVRLHGPQGWVFQPQQLSVTCDSRSCNGGQDVNFEVTGVELSGHLQAGPVSKSCKANTPPLFSGVTVSTQASGSGRKDKPLSAAATDVGTFSLGPLLPGDYVITASHPHWQLDPASMTHQLSLGSPQLGAPFRIMGYRVQGSVTSKSGPVAGIQVTLLSADDDVAAGCSTTHPPGHVSMANIDAALSTTALCSVTTDAQGWYTFTGVPCGQYTLQAAHPDTDSAFEIQPPSLTVQVGQGDASLSEQFVVTGFSVSGRVVDPEGNGVPSVSIRVNGKERASTDINGRYVLARMQEGKTDVSAEKADFEFSKLAAVSITPSAQVLPDILVKKIGICGRLSYGDAQFKQSSKKVTLTALDGSGVNMHTLADNMNKWCFLVPPGRYRVAPHVSADDKAKGLVVAPTHVDVLVNGEPELALVFGQAKLAIHGNVFCLDGPCPDDVEVVVHTAPTGTKVLSGKLKDIPASEDHPAAGKGRAFTFHKVRPGKYHISAGKEGWCWEGAQLAFTVQDADGVAPDLKQRGYELQVEANQPVELFVSSEDNTAAAPFQVPAVQGKTTICLPGQGRYTLAPKGCYIFSSQAYTVSVSADSPAQPLKLTAARAYVDGAIRVTSSSGAVTSSPLPPSIEIGTISIDPADSVVEAGVVATATQLNPETEPGLYTYTLALDLGSTVGIEAVQPDGGLLMFKPTRTRYTVTAGSGGCPEAVPDIAAFEGVVVSGATEPAVGGADVKVTYTTPSALSGKSAGDVAATGVTKSDGSFAVGPLPEDATYTVEVAKAGHVLTQEAEGEQGGLKFSSKQLAQVTVTVNAPDGTDPSGVFLSLSGSGGFKHNTRLGPDSTSTFQGLQPGTFYLKPLLREHSFDPPVADIQLEDGQQLQLGLTAVRAAWGISGAVKSVGGAPLGGAVVEACRGDSGVVLDSALTDESGAYRVGGLKPGHTYLMRVRLDGRVISAHPAGRKVTLGEADQPGIDFTAFRTSPRSAVTAALSADLPATFRASVKAELVPATASGGAVAGSNPVGVVVFDGSGFMELRGVKQGSYVLKLSCPAGTAGPTCEPWETAVQVTSKDLHLGVLPFHPSAAEATGAPAGATSTAAPGTLGASSEPISHEGLDWKLPVIVLVLFIAAATTILKPTIADILQLNPVLTSSAADAQASFGSKAAGNSSFGGSSAATRAAVAAAAAVPVPDADLTSEWASEGDQRSLGVGGRSKNVSMRSRSSRRA